MRSKTSRLLSPLVAAVSFTAACFGPYAVAAPQGSTASRLPALTGTLSRGRLRVAPPSGHHFNPAAPARARLNDRDLPLRLKERSLEVHLLPGAEGKAVSVEAFICDDAKTFCLKKSQKFDIPAPTKR